MKEIDMGRCNTGDNVSDIKHPLFNNETVMSPRVAHNARYVTLPIIECENKIAAEIIAPCPPGIPLIIPGERINTVVIEYLCEKNLKNEMIVLS